MRPGFAPYDFTGEYDLAQSVQRLPPGTTQRGMFLQGVLEEAIKQGKPLPGNKHYTSFKEYPAAEGYRLSLEVAQHLYPDAPIREGLRRMGHTVYPTLLTSMIGRALFGVLGKKIEPLMRLVPKGYSISTKEAVVELRECSAHEALFCFRSFADFDLSFHIGVLEGIVHFCKKTPTCVVKRNSPTEAEIFCSWVDEESA